MKSHVILFCILVYCSKIVESNPLSEEIVQRASKYNLPANNAHRLYDNADVARPHNVNPSYGYRQPTDQQYKQQWQNNENYRPYNQFKPRQPGKFNYRNGYNNKNWVHSNQPVNIVKPAPAILDSSTWILTAPAETFIPPVPVQNQREWLNNMEQIPPVKPQYYQEPRPWKPTGVFQKPAVQGPSLPQPQYVVPAKNQPLQIIIPRNPIHTLVQDPANLHPNIQSLINNEQVQNVLRTNKDLRGFLIMHPNGTLEQVDEIEEMHKTHPNYIMMNVGDIIQNQSPIAFSPTPVPLSTSPIDQALVQPNPSPDIAIPSNVVTSPTKPLGYPQWNDSYYKPYNRPVSAPNGATVALPPYIQNKLWPGYMPKDVDNYKLTALLPLNQNTTPIPNIAITTSLEDAVPKVNVDSEPIDDDQLGTELIEDSEDVLLPSIPDVDDDDSTTPVVPSLITIAPTVPSDDITSLLDAPTTVPTPMTQSFVTPDIPNDKGDTTSPRPSGIITPKPDQVTTPKAVPSTSTTPTPIVNIPVTTPTTESSINIDITTPDYVEDDDDNDDDTEIITLSPIEIPINDSATEPDGTEVDTTVITETVSIATVDDIPKIVDEKNTVKSPCPTALNEMAEIDLSNLKTTSKPIVWFRTTNAEFWDKLTKSNDYDTIYFIQMQPQPIIQKDTKTTVFPNGTIYEEITENKWERNDDSNPNVTKTIKITHP